MSQFCGSCGAQIPDGSYACPNCGQPVQNQNGQYGAQQYQNNYPYGNQSNGEYRYGNNQPAGGYQYGNQPNGGYQYNNQPVGGYQYGQYGNAPVPAGNNNSGTLNIIKILSAVCGAVVAIAAFLPFINISWSEFANLFDSYFYGAGAYFEEIMNSLGIPSSANAFGASTIGGGILLVLGVAAIVLTFAVKDKAKAMMLTAGAGAASAIITVIVSIYVKNAMVSGFTQGFNMYGSYYSSLGEELASGLGDCIHNGIGFFVLLAASAGVIIFGIIGAVTAKNSPQNS